MLPLTMCIFQGGDVSIRVQTMKKTICNRGRGIRRNATYRGQPIKLKTLSIIYMTILPVHELDIIKMESWTCSAESNPYKRSEP